jgi:putative flippase GtrA
MGLKWYQLNVLWRYYQVGVINTLFGYGLFAAFVWIGLNLYVAQVLAHIVGMGFNYISYSRHVFSNAVPARGRFVLAYGFNYLIGLACLAIASLIVRSPYLAGIFSIIASSLINFFVLRHLVFWEQAS